MDDPNNTSDAEAASTSGAVAPTVKLLTRRKAQQQPQDSSSVAATTAAVKVELSDSQDESDSVTIRPAMPSTSAGGGVSTRKAAARNAAVKRTIINVDAWCSDDEEEFAGFDIQNGCNDLRHKSKKIKEEPLSDHEPVDIKLEVKMENDTEDDDEAAAEANVPSGAVLPARRTPKRISSPPKLNPMTSTAAAAAAAAAAVVALVEQQLIAQTSTVTTPTSGNKSTTNVTDPRYRKPFTFGWKRELVYRAHNDVHRKQYDKAEVYYITPAGKKLRTRADILINLTEGLDANDFTFAREPIGMSAEEEIIRSAKLQAPSLKRPVNFLDLGEPDPTLGFGKRVPKPKVPKGASPPPSGSSAAASSSAAAAAAMLMAKQGIGGRNSMGGIKQLGADLDKSSGKTPKGSKAKGEPCTIQCVLAMGTIPQLQCKKCLCLFHPECVVRRPSVGPAHINYVCESCLHEPNEPSDAITVGSSAASTSSAISVGGNNINSIAGGSLSGGIAPSHLGAASLVGAITASAGVPAVALSASVTEQQRNRKRINSNTGNGGSGSNNNTAINDVANSSELQTSATAAAGTGDSRLTANGSNATQMAAPTGSTVIGGITTWMPSTANLTTNRAELNINSTPPQSIAIVAGRKYIMVPKTNLMSVSPSGDVKIGDNTGMPLHYVNESAASPASKISTSTPNATSSTNNNASTVAAPTTGDDVSPPFKKRLLSRSASGKPQTPTASPGRSSSNQQQHPPTTVASAAATTATNTETRSSKRGQQPQQQSSSTSTAANSTAITATVGAAPAAPVSIATTSSSSSSSSSVHTLFATNFFNNVSTGYNVLMHTFQYLKVQELLRAACVCRMWNQAAQNSLLWRTVRMKNSQVNDWSGLVSTLKRNGTKHLDLRKMLIPAAAGNADDAWLPFSAHIGRHSELEAIDLCRLPARVVERLLESNPALRVLNAVSIKDEHINLLGADRLQHLRELRLKSLNSMHIDGLLPLQTLQHLQHLSLTSIKELGTKGVQVLGHLAQLESLELGECSELAAGFAGDVLLRLPRLQRLRLEKGVEKCCTFEIIDAIAQMPALSQLELVNFDIKPEFDAHLQRCRNIKRLLVIPTYISQSATTNHMILNALLKLAGNLEQLTWVVTLELLRVTELYVDQCDGKRRDRKLSEDKIPVLKPVPGMSDKEMAGGAKATAADVPQVEILPLEKVEKILASHMPTTNFAIIKLPYHATWRQCMADGGQ